MNVKLDVYLGSTETIRHIKNDGVLVKKILYELKEIDTFAISMVDALNLLEKLEIIDNATVWDELRVARNAITHDYPLDANERIHTIQLVKHFR